MKKTMVGLLAGVVAWAAFGAGEVSRSPEKAADDAVRELWARFVDKHGVLRDYEGELPTPKDCVELRPNAMGWWSPIENGPMFTGPFLKSMILRAKRTGSGEDRARCRKLAEGLLLCASVSDVPGMICRGVGTDGKCHYPLGSCDQTLPWFLGVDAYVRSGLCEPSFKRKLVDKLLEVALAMEKVEWKVPCDGQFRNEFRGDFVKDELPFRGATHYLFILRSIADITGDAKWKAKYAKARDEKYPLFNSVATRLDVCAYGYRYDIEKIPKPFPVEPGQLWIYVGAVECLAELAAREENPEIAARYRGGLKACAKSARKFLKEAFKYSNVAERPFKYANWREGWRWRPQKTQKDADRVACEAVREVLGNRKEYERGTMTAPLACAAICAFAGEYGDEVFKAISHYDYSTIAVCEFFFSPLAFEYLKAKGK